MASLWKELDLIKTNPNYFFICATNTPPENIHSTFIDRFEDHLIEIPVPNEQTRKDIIYFYINKINKEFNKSFKIDEKDINDLVIKTKNFGVRTIKAIVGAILRKGIGQKDTIIKFHQDKYDKQQEKIKKDKHEKERAERMEKIAQDSLALGLLSLKTNIDQNQSNKDNSFISLLTAGSIAYLTKKSN